jgi:ferredoxin
MALIILEDCIACDACVPPCPTNSIVADDPIYLIDPKTCTECVGFATEPTCVVACPVDCIVVDSAHIESEEVLMQKYKKMQEA